MAGMLPDGIEVEFGRRYRSMFSYKAKNYALLDTDGHVTIKGAALKSRGMEPFLRDYLDTMIRHLLEEKPAEAEALAASMEADLRARKIPVEKLARTEFLQDSPASYQKKIAASSRNRSAAFEVALRSAQDYKAGDQIRYYISGDSKKVTAYEAAKPLDQYDPSKPDENIPYYSDKLHDLAAKFQPFFPKERDLFGL
jgi:DNA polymerase elongation subunit (family B)